MNSTIIITYKKEKIKRLLISVIVLIALSGCFSEEKEDVQFSIHGTLMKLHINDMSDIYADILNDTMEKIQIDTLQNNVLFRYRKETEFSQYNLYIVVHDKDTLGGKYLSLIYHKQSDSLFCQTKMKLSDYSIRLFSIEDSIIKEISKTFVDPKNYKGYAEIMRQKTKTQIVPTVYRDSVVLDYDNQKLVYRWLGDTYGLMISDYLNRFEQPKIRTTDDDFTAFYIQFVQFVFNKDTADIIAHTYFPISAKVDYFDRNYELKDSSFTINADELHNYFWALEEIINYDENYPDKLYIPKLSSYSTNKIGDKSICEQSLAFEIGAQLGLEIVHFYFVKLDGKYKLAEYYSYSINHPGE
ncbi:MAG: hypothetical protein ABFS35_09345 [Bacteroidota bacterium]